MQKAFIAVDPLTNRVLGHRAGFLDNPMPEPNEIEVPFEGFDFSQYIFKKYNVKTQQFISDSETTKLLAEIPLASTQITIISPTEFKQLFTLPERVAIKTLQAQDLLVQEFHATIDDPRFLAVDLNSGMVRYYLDHLVATNTITAERKTAVLANQQP